MAGVIMAVLGLLAAEDLKYKAVTVWKLDWCVPYRQSGPAF